MKIITIQPYAVMTCNAPTGKTKKGDKIRGCPNAAKHMCTVQNDPSNPFAYSSYRLCDGHLDDLKSKAVNEDDDS